MRIYLLLLFLFSFQFSFAQLEKKTWLLGGNASFEQSEYQGTAASKSSELEVSLNTGYFFWNKLAVGLRGSLNNFVSKFPDYPNAPGTERRVRATTWSTGPFVRYYFLAQDKPVNLFADASGQYYHSTNNSNNFTGKSWATTAAAGAAFFLNKVLALELLMAYRHAGSYNISIGDNSNHLQFKASFNPFCRSKKATAP
ncbi:MAG TPA: outer membrane beta-barrel protein, partial [Flavisolibacter sp.]|nr:outer membrane beta-barrel protein [Flavisolibacter sp.]